MRLIICYIKKLSKISTSYVIIVSTLQPVMSKQ